MASTLMAPSRLVILACMLTSVTAFNVPMPHPPVRYTARSRPVFSLFESLGSRFGRDGETDNDVALFRLSKSVVHLATGLGAERCYLKSGDVFKRV